MEKQRVEVVVFGGIKFRRYPESDRREARVYYVPGGTYRARGVGRLHEEVWKGANGPVPPGHHVHHVDGNPLNNEIGNLECISAAAHAEEHRHDPRPWTESSLALAREAAKAWHGSDDGRAWHAEHARRIFAGRAPYDVTCDSCGERFSTRTVQRARVRFCSKRCKAKHRRASGIDDEPRTCPGCGATFMVNRYDRARHCSRPCGQRARRATG